MIDFDVLEKKQGQKPEKNLLQRPDPLDPRPLIALFDKYHGELDTLASQASALTVEDDTGAQIANDMISQLAILRRKIRKKKDEIKRPYLDVIQPIDAAVKRFVDRLSDLEWQVKRKLTPYLQKKEEERREAERKAREEAARLQAELERKAKEEAERLAAEARAKALAEGKEKAEAEAEARAVAAMAEPAPVVVPDVPKETKIESEIGGSKLKEIWTFEILNLKEMPDEAFEARREQVEKALKPWINAQIRAGIRNIPGVRIFRQVETKTVTKRKG